MVRCSRQCVVIVAAVALAVVGCGCTSYRSARLPTAAEMQPQEAAEQPVRRGSRVRVVLADGKTITGEVSRATPDEIAIGKVGNYGYQEQVIRREEMLELEVQDSSKAEDALGTTIGVVAVGFLTVLIFFGLGLSIGSN